MMKRLKLDRGDPKYFYNLRRELDEHTPGIPMPQVVITSEEHDRLQKNLKTIGKPVGGPVDRLFGIDIRVE